MYEAATLILLLMAGAMFIRTFFYSILAECKEPIGVILFFNLVLLGAEIGVIALGWRRNLPGLVNLGIFVFFVHVVTRYFDLLTGMLSGGLLFIGAGILLIFGGLLLERSRRRLIEAIQQRSEAQ